MSQGNKSEVAEKIFILKRLQSLDLTVRISQLRKYLLQKAFFHGPWNFNNSRLSTNEKYTDTNTRTVWECDTENTKEIINRVSNDAFTILPIHDSFFFSRYYFYFRQISYYCLNDIIQTNSCYYFFRNDWGRKVSAHIIPDYTRTNYNVRSFIK